LDVRHENASQRQCGLFSTGREELREKRRRINPGGISDISTGSRSGSDDYLVVRSEMKIAPLRACQTGWDLSDDPESVFDPFRVG
jgi:hypothetical protein